VSALRYHTFDILKTVQHLGHQRQFVHKISSTAGITKAVDFCNKSVVHMDSGYQIYIKDKTYMV